MSYDLASARAALVQWAASVSGLTVIQSHQSGPRPALPFGVVQVLSMETPGTAASEQKDLTPDDTVHRQWHVLRVQFSFFGGDPVQACHDLRESIELQSTGDTLKADGLSPGVSGPVTDQPQLRENGFEPSAVVEISFHAASEFTETVGYIETVTTSPTFNR